MSGTPLTDLKGIGPKTAGLFRKIGISSQEELLHFYPRDYDIYSFPVSPGQAVPGEKNAVAGRVSRRPSVKRFGNNSVTMLILEEPAGKLQINWFHMPYLRNTLQPGADCVFRGMVIEKNGRRILQHPEIFTPEEYRKKQGQMLPVYALTAGLANRTVRRVMESVLSAGLPVSESLPEDILRDYDLCGLDEAIRNIHFPNSAGELLRARRRLVFEEFFIFQMAVSSLKNEIEEQPDHFPMQKTGLAEKVIQNLPYTLTGAQQRVWEEVLRDLRGDVLMHRLIQGDVGSGKTILAFLAMLTACENGYQSALMAPTEVLAEQHFEALHKLLASNGIKGVRPVLLTGSCTASEKGVLRGEISSGSARMIIGTHALIQEAVSYSELGLVITDEQHRFGVRQREILREKGDPPHVLVMSATPIPRTLARILYGDLDISVLDEMPAGRLPVKNCVVDTSFRETAYRFFEKETAAGHQVYVVCPMVEPDEDLSLENVVEYAARLAKRMEGKAAVGMLHGRMRPAQKQAVIEAFARGEIQILVSTTVIEVGIDVANATVMMVENAERFGLAQLHQLRGRVGRGKAQSYCIFMQGDGKEETGKRLDILNHSNDGFEIAEEDLKLRGPGDLFGIRQSGAVLFRIADIYRDAGILNLAHQAAEKILSEDPLLNEPQNREIKNRILELAYYRQKDYDV